MQDAGGVGCLKLGFAQVSEKDEVESPRNCLMAGRRMCSRPMAG